MLNSICLDSSRERNYFDLRGIIHLRGKLPPAPAREKIFLAKSSKYKMVFPYKISVAQKNNIKKNKRAAKTVHCRVEFMQFLTIESDWGSGGEALNCRRQKESGVQRSTIFWF